MPTVHWLTNCKITIYADDHFPPHFHVVGKGWRCSVNLESFELMAGAAPRKDLREALEWANENRVFLASKWSEFNERD